MKKNIFAILLISAVALPVFAQTPLSEPPSNINVVGVLNKIGVLLISIAAPIAVIMVIVSGFYFMTAQGEPGKLETAKKMLLWTLIGMAVVLMANAVVAMITRLVSG